MDEEHLLGLSSLLPQEQETPSGVRTPMVSAPPSTPKAEDVPLPRFLFSFGLSPSGPASAEMLLSLLHHEGMKSVDSRLKECGVKAIGKRLQIQNVLQNAAATSSVIPPAPRDMPKPVAVQVESVIVVTGDVSSIKAKPAREVLDELTGGQDSEPLIALAAEGNREALAAALKQRGFKTGVRLKLEQALTTVVAEREAAENLRVVEQAQEAVLTQNLEERRAERTAALEAEAEVLMVEQEAAQAAEEEMMAELYAQYEREMGEAALKEQEAPLEIEAMSEVEKLKQARREANAARRKEVLLPETEPEKSAPNGETAPDKTAPVLAAVLDGIDDTAPVLAAVLDGTGGVQGLANHNAVLQRDADGDDAHEFLEVS